MQFKFTTLMAVLAVAMLIGYTDADTSPAVSAPAVAPSPKPSGNPAAAHSKGHHHGTKSWSGSHHGTRSWSSGMGTKTRHNHPSGSPAAALADS